MSDFQNIGRVVGWANSYVGRYSLEYGNQTIVVRGFTDDDWEDYFQFADRIDECLSEVWFAATIVT